MAKTKPIGVRFDEELQKKMKEAKIADSAQRQVNYFEQLFLDTHDAAMGRIKLNGVFSKEKAQNIPASYPAEEIEKQIAAIKAEKIPEARNTIYGKKVWVNEQQSRINNLKMQLK